jgi:hypothetical protein
MKLAKIYYRDREVKYINITFGGEHNSIYIGSASEISGKQNIIMHHDLIEHDNDGHEKEFSVSLWEIDHLDKVQVRHIDSGIMIEWISGSTGEVKASSFIPMLRILYIKVDDPQDVNDEPIPKGIIEK